MHIVYVRMLKPFSTLVINDNNCLYHNIIVYKLDPFSNWCCDIRNSNLKTIFVLFLIDVIPNLNLNNILTMLSTRVHSCSGCGKRMKLTYRLTRHMNTCTSHQVFPIHKQPKQDTPILEKDDNALENFVSYENDESEEQDIKKDHRNLVGKSSDTWICIRDGLSVRIPQDGLLVSESSAILREVRFSE